VLWDITHLFCLRSHDLLILASDPCAQTPFHVNGVIFRIRVPSVIFNHA